MNRRSLLARAAAALFAGLVPTAFRRKAIARPVSRVSACVPHAPGVGFPVGAVLGCLRGVNSAPLPWEPVSHCKPGMVRLASARTHETAHSDGRIERVAEYVFDINPAGWGDLPLVDYGRLPWDAMQVLSIEPVAPWQKMA